MANYTVAMADIVVCDYRGANPTGPYHNSGLSPMSSVNPTTWAGYETMNYVTRVQFVTTKIASSVTISMRSGSNGGSNTSGGVTLKYKLLDTDDTAYWKASTSTASDGSFTWNATDYGVNSVTVTRTIPAGTHYLYIWTGATSATALNYGSFRWQGSGTYVMSIVYAELVGAVRIGNGSGWDIYTVWIGNGSGWDQYIPYVGNGSGWDVCG